MAAPTYTTPVFPCTSRFVARNSIVQARMLIQDVQLTLTDDHLAIRPKVQQIANELAVAENALCLCGC